MPVLLRHLDQLPERLCGGAISIGNFDGVHKGHVRIIERLVAMAHTLGGPAVVLTFDPHPASILRPNQVPTPIIGTERKAELLTAAGADAVIAYPTDVALLQMEPRAFFDCIVRDQLHAHGMVEGENFFFGHDRGGTIDVLARFCESAGIPLEVIRSEMLEGEMVSSSRIRELLAEGQADRAAAMLTRPYRIRGVVVHGQGRGNGLGYPTANIERIDTILPAEGIYAGIARIDGIPHPTAISLGSNPTFGEDALKVEAFLIDYEDDLYDRAIEVDFLARLRDIEKFESVELLIAQIAEDVERTRQLVAAYGRSAQ